MDDTPNGLLLFGIAFALALTLVITLWAINVLPGKVRAWWNMSSAAARLTAIEAGDKRVRHQVPEPVSVSAKPNPEGTGGVPGGTGASAIDTSARDIIRASVVAELLDSGLLTNRDKAICLVFRCSKASSSRPEAPFQVALRLVEQHRAKARPEMVGEMIDRVHREVAAEHIEAR
jgi:hypothetical protein